ncbi:Phosphoribosylformimino-5-aminoimidazole carboxamide ribotide isomerase [Bathymodiolus thermophilus thioautotrophic gill symbiont]|jgi:phosphoribosylformimino-5-aminoimidazole carboxamide ribotide isomerase|uniref:1-(5-phosphoribosyl)-5-[(5-phosphoribosylamino)methylideneamino] imidazole-4-carboxamide isomerase n=1 Tax=Bathymodiolus thermophilus thioautotrophic gill symbiont TaxID=2360 RepID=A0A1J5TVB9_9GAMM|nr:1-(5-phosphoribosyl)-5-[(5-phosphoribosylamino)methylideneamino]imidazole-4-carboxamide isomerase [Bathymodiolus thermophilus thioautotrophic gill symbiont]OIR24116.1 1-(5-phosphoribosyl)-5-[(5-phosphoribosylamino)methylideneamino]imidazole-4-carboxamide isomerase [Bathymodiolus thermophilus thioautotrophic gill symbiont]CAB5498913.1 Phosphoribosylformimino-5-aminoimidazole carboxamide ribotide isomerase (EC [Bathymodiolus thermophilus thioautotrophic gill symbiont]CAB5504729.1 Phosphoribosyl
MIIIPAIDLKDGQCVRLRQGLMEDSTVFSDNPVDMAAQWVAQGAKRLHLVDLNGAFEGKPMNADSVMAITQAFPELPVQIGGGIRNMEVASAYIEAGIGYLIIGSKAVTHPQFVTELCGEFAGKIIVGLDANDGFVAIDGWATKTDKQVSELAKRFEQDGVSSIVYTDIARDGMMQGVNVEATANLAKQTSIPIIASGGITNMQDISGLLVEAHHGITGAITGRAIYEGTLDFAKAQKLCDEH